MVTQTAEGTPSIFQRLLEAAARAKVQGAGDLSEEGSRVWHEACVEHLAVFEDWLALGLRQKQADIEQCAANDDGSAARLLATWAPPAAHKELLPRWALPHQRDLFAMELAVLHSIAHPASEHSGASLEWAVAPIL